LFQSLDLFSFPAVVPLSCHFFVVFNWNDDL
jgi:hypothetical protein